MPMLLPSARVRFLQVFLPPLLVEGVADAIDDSRAIKIFICNLMTQPGETDGLTSRRHHRDRSAITLRRSTLITSSLTMSRSRSCSPNYTKKVPNRSAFTARSHRQRLKEPRSFMVICLRKGKRFATTRKACTSLYSTAGGEARIWTGQKCPVRMRYVRFAS